MKLFAAFLLALLIAGDCAGENRYGYPERRQRNTRRYAPVFTTRIEPLLVAPTGPGILYVPDPDPLREIRQLMLEIESEPVYLLYDRYPVRRPIFETDYRTWRKQ